MTQPPLGRSTPSTSDTASWLQPLEKEAVLLQELASIAGASRDVMPDSEALLDLLRRQAQLCQQLERYRQQRVARMLEVGQDSQRPDSDFLTVVLGLTPPDQREMVVQAFDRYVEAARCAQREVQINRHFFEAALAAVEGTLNAVARAARGTPTYGTGGLHPSSSTALRLSTCT